MIFNIASYMSINEVQDLKIQLHMYFMKNQSLATKDYTKVYVQHSTNTVAIY